MSAFEVLEFANQFVVFGVGDLGLGERVIQPPMVVDGLAKLGDSSGDRG